VNLALGDGADGAFRLVEDRQTRDVIQQDGLGRGVGDEIGESQNDVGVAMVE
jgi:hypothetical protein